MAEPDGAFASQGRRARGLTDLPPRKKIAVVLKGYPRLSETFIAQELLGLEKAGLELVLISLRKPTDTKRHPIHGEIAAEIRYLPEYLHDEPLRVIRSIVKSLTFWRFWRALGAFAGDFLHDPTPHRIRRFGQAAVLAAEWPNRAEWLHAHFIHTPASVAAYSSLITGVPWTCSAHAKDIWTTPDRDLAAKMSAARWIVACSKAGLTHLRRFSTSRTKLLLSYHGIDLARFGKFTRTRPCRNGLDTNDPVMILSVGRAVEKKGYDVLLRALAMLPRELAWRFVHIGGGERVDAMKALGDSIGLGDRILWKGAQAQDEVLRHYRQADVFALACRIGSDGDRDGLPNVLVEACSQKLVCVSTDVSGVTELLSDGVNGIVVEPDNPQVFAKALVRLITDPAYRARLGDAAEQRVRERFDCRSSVRQLVELFEYEWRGAE
jgi:glycosyltransferase involved in cell wall biosynthesis